MSHTDEQGRDVINKVEITQHVMFKTLNLKTKRLE